MSPLTLVASLEGPATPTNRHRSRTTPPGQKQRRTAPVQTFHWAGFEFRERQVPEVTVGSSTDHKIGCRWVHCLESLLYPASTRRLMFRECLACMNDKQGCNCWKRQPDDLEFVVEERCGQSVTRTAVCADSVKRSVKNTTVASSASLHPSAVTQSRYSLKLSPLSRARHDIITSCTYRNVCRA